MATHIEARLRPHLLDEEQRGDAQLLAPERRALEIHKAPPQTHAPPAPITPVTASGDTQEGSSRTNQTAFIIRRLMV
jgi:hypothetical protein